ncbi:MAG: LPXTG cell wall anchor domain-containing protein, partial [Acidimicrobiia bacterium]
AQAHNGTVGWDCDGWEVDLNNYGAGADITIIVDGGTPITSTNWINYDNSGSWDDTESHTLYVEVDAYDDADQPVYNNVSSPFSPNWQSGEYSFTLNVTQEACSTPPTTTPPTTTPPTTEVPSLPQVNASCDEGTSQFEVSVDNISDETVYVDISWDSGTNTGEVLPGATVTVTVPAGESYEVVVMDSDQEVTILEESGVADSCDEVLPTSITAAPTTPPVEVEPTDQLPFTGVESGTPALLALALIAAGGLALLATRRAED